MQLGRQCTRQFSLYQRGVGLIEVLISLLIIAIGVLGMVAVHSSSMQFNQSSYIQSQATFLATDMLDRIQANADVAKSSDDYRVELDGLTYNQCVASNYPVSCESSSCSPEQLALYDVKQWKFQLICQIPGTKGAISYSDSGSHRIYTIQLSFPNMGNRVPLSDIVLRGIL
ncbi:type IV pilus modification protein PilV [uncultured Endozoicomonas sp.]|uniref:type IV pilus modification protein PilV n=1 Tax=uncultured Endozoicomonas sp. TaxID=432652 RepID=UPI0026060BBB|nr:type IV pilus modification protein PilV [uncultured Endozoicomonas sp.]